MSYSIHMYGYTFEYYDYLNIILIYFSYYVFITLETSLARTIYKISFNLDYDILDFYRHFELISSRYIIFFVKYDIFTIYFRVHL